MRTHGWAGELPDDEVQARSRILAATRHLMATGTSPGIAEVARTVGISRQTVYRYYGATEDLLDAAALDALVGMLEQLAEHVDATVRTARVDHADVLVEIVLWVHRHLLTDPVLCRLVTPGQLSRHAQALTRASSISLGGDLL